MSRTSLISTLDRICSWGRAPLAPSAIACMFLSAILGLTLVGCRPRPQRAVNSDVLEETQQLRSAAEQAYDMLARIEEFERGPAMSNVLASLTAQLANEKPLPDWQPDPLVARLPKNIRSLPPFEQLDKLSIQGSDAQYLEEAILMRKIGAWVTQQKLPADLAAWLKTNKSLSPEAAEDLGMAYLLFDWTIRNISLDELLPEPKDIASAGQSGGGNVPAPLRGIPGPGYLAQPWHIAMTGHGDAWQRARLFILLARQQGIEAVMLAKTDPKDRSQATPWACAVLLGEDLYLFDPAIGLPIPTKDGGIATYAQVRADGELLRALDVDSDHVYNVAADEIESVHVFLDASLESLTQRMVFIQRALAGERQLKLVQQPSNLAARLRKAPGVANVSLWIVPLQAMLFQAAFAESPGFDPRLRQSIFEERLLIEQRTGVAEARYKHLRGQFSNTEGEKGAKSLYVESRVPEEQIEAIDTDARLHQQLGIAEEVKRRKDPQERQAFLDSIKQRMRRGKQDCSYWLGLVHYETGNYETAVNWLDQRTIKAPGDHYWNAAAHYNLGRTYEQLNAPQLAQEQYLAVESAAQPGALIRAKRLQSASSAAKTDE